MYLPHPREGSRTANEVDTFCMRVNTTHIVLTDISRSFQWTMRILGFFTLGLLIITNLVRGSCLYVSSFCKFLFLGVI